MPFDHYISQVHLRKFYSPVLGERMYALRKSDLRSFTPSSGSVCGINDGSTNLFLKEHRAIEDFLRTIEPKYDKSLAKLTKGDIDEECIYTIGGFVAYFQSCSPAGMRIQSEPLKSIVEAEAALLEASGRIPKAPKELGGKSLAGLMDTGAVKVEVDQKFPQAIGINSILESVAIFGNFRWDILLNDFNEIPFFTSDSPVAIEKTRDRRIINRIVPLSPNLAIRIRPDLTIDKGLADLSFANFRCHRRKISHKEAVEINRLIVRCAEDIVFYRDDSPWVQRFIAKNRHYRVELTKSKQRAGNGFLVTSKLEIVPAAFPPKSPI
jgi:hypothetical protein